MAGALAVTFGLVGIDLAHAFEQVVDVGPFDFRRGRAAAGRRRIGTAAGRTRFLVLVGHKVILVRIYFTSTVSDKKSNS